MHPIFIAHGPAFRNNHIVMESFNNVDLYPLFCHILHLNPAPNDGDFRNIEHFLQESVTFDTGLIISKCTYSVNELLHC